MAPRCCVCTVLLMSVGLKFLCRTFFRASEPHTVACEVFSCLLYRMACRKPKKLTKIISITICQRAIPSLQPAASSQQARLEGDYEDGDEGESTRRKPMKSHLGWLLFSECGVRGRNPWGFVRGVFDPVHGLFFNWNKLSHYESQRSVFIPPVTFSDCLPSTIHGAYM